MKSKRRKKINPNTLILLKQIGVGVLVCLAAGLLLLAVWHGSRVETFTLQTVKVVGGETIDHAQVEARIWKELEGEYAGFIPKRFTWLYPKQQIFSSLQEIDRIHDIQIHRQNKQTLAVSFLEYVPSALWCNDVASSDCAFLTSDGYAFAAAPELSGGSFLRFVKTGNEYQLHSTFVEEVEFQSLNHLVQLLETYQWFVSHVEIDKVGDAFLQLVGGGELKISINESPDDTYENLLVVLGSPEFSHLKPGAFVYIDLRYGDKVYVNEFGVAPADEEKTASSSDVAIESL